MTVFRLPEEPPIGTVLRPEPDNGKRYTRYERGWSETPYKTVCVVGPWANLLHFNLTGLVVVEPDPHPTPWTVGPWPSKDGEIVWSAQDATGCPVMETSSLDVAMRIVDAVNKAATT